MSTPFNKIYTVNVNEESLANFTVTTQEPEVVNESTYRLTLEDEDPCMSYFDTSKNEWVYNGLNMFDEMVFGLLQQDEEFKNTWPVFYMVGITRPDNIVEEPKPEMRDINTSTTPVTGKLRY